MNNFFRYFMYLTVTISFLMIFTSACDNKGKDKLLLMPGPAGTNGTNGTNGISILWLGTLSSEPVCDDNHLNNAYYNSTDGISYVCKGSSWDILAQDGTNEVIGIKLSYSENQTIPSATGTAITFDTVEEDTSGFYNSSNPTRITIPEGGDGYYIVEGYLVYTPSTTGYRDVAIYLNGSQYTIYRGVATDVYSTPCFITIALKLSAGDYLELFAGHTAGTDLYVVNNDDIDPYFAAYRIGE